MTNFRFGFLAAVSIFSNLACSGPSTSTDPSNEQDVIARAPQWVARTDPHAGPECILRFGGSTYLGIPSTHRVMRVEPDGTLTEYAHVPMSPEGMTLMLVLSADRAGNIYAPIATFSSAPAGIYKIPAGGGVGVPFATNAEPPFFQPNGTKLSEDGYLFVADSQGVVYRVSPSGEAVAWSRDSVLTGDHHACGSTFPFDVGANGIVVEEDAVYVSNTDRGSIVRFPIRADGSAGAAEIIASDCALSGIDGFAFDVDRSILLVNNRSNSVQRVGRDGSIRTLFSGAPLDFPTDLAFETRGRTRSLLVAVAAYNSGAGDAALPETGLLRFPLPAR